MKRTNGILILAMLLISGSVQAKEYKIATISPDGLAWMKEFRNGVRQIDEDTDGRVKFRIYPGSVMGDDITVLRKMRSGQLHGGVIVAGSLTRFYPDLQVYNLPLIFKSHEEVAYIRSRMDQTIIDGLHENGLESFYLTETGFAYLLSKDPVKSVDDVKKLKAWIPDGDPIAAELIKSFDVSPIPLGIPDILAGLQTGIIDAVVAPPVAALALQWHNHVEYLLDLPLLYVYSMLVLDRKSFGKISQDDQVVTRELLNKVFKRIDGVNRLDNQKAFQALVTHGLKVITPGEKELPEWEAVAGKSIDDLVASGEISAEIVNTFNRYIRDYRKSPEAVAQ